MVPVNIRREGDRGELGNKVSSLFVELPVAEADPLRRYELVRATAEERKAGEQALAAGAVTGLTELAPPVLHAGLARAMSAKRLFNVTITNIPGSPRRVYAFGAPMVDDRADRAARGRARGRDRRRLLRRRGDVRVYTPIAPLCPTSMYSETASSPPCSSLRRWRTRQRRHVSGRPLRASPHDKG
jgi:WS/DGAT C-terminal domain